MSAEKLKTLGDYRENPIVQKNQRNEAFMAAWKETLLVIEWAKKREAEKLIETAVKIKSKKREVEDQIVKGTKIKSKKPEPEHQIVNDTRIKSEIVGNRERMIYLNSSLVQNIGIKPQPGKNKYVLIASSQNTES